MTISQIADLEGVRLVCGAEKGQLEITCACASDLMSDVLTLDCSHMLIVTGLCNVQTIRTAEMSDSAAILLVRGKEASAEMIALAREARIAVLEYSGGMFEACGELYMQGVKPAV